MLARVKTCAVVGLDGQIVEFEVDFNPRADIPSFTIVGLLDAAVKESRERVRSAIKNSNRSTIRRMRGGNSQWLGLPSATLEDQNASGEDKSGFGLQFPINGHESVYPTAIFAH